MIKTIVTAESHITTFDDAEFPSIKIFEGVMNYISSDGKTALIVPLAELIKVEQFTR